MQALIPTFFWRNLLPCMDLGSKAPPPKWDILPNTGVTKPGADRFPKVEGERIDERLEAQPEAPSPP